MNQSLQCSNSTFTGNGLINCFYYTLLTNTLKSKTEPYPENKSRYLGSNILPTHYDFIVVGAGSAGSVVASRLTEDPNCNVLLIEAGGKPGTNSDIPAFRLSPEPKDVWTYNTEPQPGQCEGYPNKTCTWLSGKVLGGGSSVNGMIYARGARSDYDSWNSFGSFGWDYDTILYYFKKSENITIPEFKGSNNHGKSGLLKTSDGFDNTFNKAATFLRSAVKELGYKLPKDLNNGSPNGFGILQSTIYKGIRMNTARAFLTPIRKRNNLYVLQKSKVTKIIIVNSTACGVELVHNNKKYNFNVTKEVVLSAGAINTPKLLMLSGIGPMNHLKQMGIPLVSDIPVGENLQNHIIFQTYVAINPLNITTARVKEMVYNFIKYSNGSLATTGFQSMNGFVNVTDKNSTLPNIQFQLFYYPKGSEKELAKLVVIYTSENQNRIIEKNKKFDIFIFSPILVQPKSVGKILLNSLNPLDNPKIFGNYFSNPEDINTLVKGIHIIQNFIDSNVFKSANASFIYLKYKNCINLQDGSDEYWKCMLAQLANAAFHQVGTCKMGPVNSTHSVVDSFLSVIGVKNLRVVDSSIMPTIVSGNTAAPAIMIGEKGSDLIKFDWLYDLQINVDVKGMFNNTAIDNAEFDPKEDEHK